VGYGDGEQLVFGGIDVVLDAAFQELGGREQSADIAAGGAAAREPRNQQANKKYFDVASITHSSLPR